MAGLMAISGVGSLLDFSKTLQIFEELSTTTSFCSIVILIYHILYITLIHYVKKEYALEQLRYFTLNVCVLEI